MIVVSVHFLRASYDYCTRVYCKNCLIPKTTNLAHFVVPIHNVGKTFAIWY